MTLLYVLYFNVDSFYILHLEFILLGIKQNAQSKRDNEEAALSLNTPKQVQSSAYVVMICHLYDTETTLDSTYLVDLLTPS